MEHGDYSEDSFKIEELQSIQIKWMNLNNECPEMELHHYIVVIFFVFLRNLHTVFHTYHTSLHPHLMLEICYHFLALWGMSICASVNLLGLYKLSYIAFLTIPFFFNFCRIGSNVILSFLIWSFESFFP